MNNTITSIRSKIAKQTDNYEQGQKFEAYIKNLFNQNSFRIKRWRKSFLIPQDTFIADMTDPDLELIFVGKNQHPFAVECKWRTQFKKGKIDWAREDQIANYLEFERKRTMPVFIAIGIGGVADNPEKLFVTPLCNICHSHEVYEHQLIPYKRKTGRSFFYDTVQLRLW